ETNETWSGASGPGNPGTIAGGVDLNGFTLTIETVSAAGIMVFRINPISGTGAIVKINNGGVRFEAANTYAGPTTINDGRIIVADAHALGVQDDTPANGTVVNPSASGSGGTLVLDGVHLGTEHLTLAGPGINSPRIDSTFIGSAVDGTVLLSGGSAWISGDLAFHGLITGPGGFALLSHAFLAHSGNNWTGGMFWADFRELRLDADNALPTFEQPQVGNFGIFRVNGHTQTLRTVTGAGFLLLGGNGQLTLTNASGTYSGIIGDFGTITLTGGTWTLTGQSVNAGTFANNGGMLVIDTGKMPAPYIQSAGQLRITNSGTAGPVTVNGGSFAPLGVGNTGNLTLAPAATYIETINGTAPASFSNVHVTGAVTLGGATLSIVTAGNIAAGTQLVIVDNDAADPVVGIFAGLPEGATVAAGGEQFRISYIGGSGNDVVLTAIGATTTALGSSVNPSSPGQNVTFTATVTGASPTGTVTFFDGSTPLGTIPLTGNGAQLSTAALVPGSHDITAQYSGDANNLPSTSNVVVQVVSAEGIPMLDWRMLAALAVAIAMIAVRMAR
ncbi:MAG TPA: Ig-like domain repeat protein, partial [Thermoanaerobaculia bacterium]|nr:Ig-like domain repeat protein [Thermoanaerobaculia bacterium]